MCCVFYVFAYVPLVSLVSKTSLKPHGVPGFHQCIKF